jgi:hypothetical protein
MRVMLVLALAVGCGPGNTVCGPGSASATGLAASGSGLSFIYRGSMEGANNDCTPTGRMVISVTIELVQDNGTGFLTFCIPRPDELATDLTIGSDMPGNEPPAALISFEGTSADGCVYAYNPGATTTGSLHATGVCNDGAGSSGFALTVDGSMTMTGSGGSSCLASVVVQLAGTVAVP